MPMKDRVRHSRELVEWVEEVHEDTVRIISLVKMNPNFFGVRKGSRFIRAAADTLERLVREAKR